MKVERTAPWASAIDYTMARILGAETWTIDVTCRSVGRRVTLARRGDVETAFPDLRERQRRLATADEIERTRFAWIETERSGPGHPSAQSGSTPLLAFAHVLANGDVLAGGVAIRRSDLASSAFGREGELVGFLADLATNFVRERRVAEERWAMQRLLSSLAFQCVVVNRAGHVIFHKGRNDKAAGSGESICQTEAKSVREITSQVLARHRSNPELLARPYHFEVVDRGNGDPLPLYVVPLRKDDAEGGAEYLALLVPRRPAPPCDEALATVLSLTPAEVKIAQCIATGKKIRCIARDASLSEQTVRTYLKRIYAKMGVTSQGELIARIGDISVPIDSG